MEKDRDSNAGDLNDDDDDEVEDGPSQRKTKSKLNIKNTALKWFIDCITLGAIMNTAAFLIIMGFLKGTNGCRGWTQSEDQGDPDHSRWVQAVALGQG